MNPWDEVLARLEAKVNRHSFYTWFRPTTFVTEDAASITVRVPNALLAGCGTGRTNGALHSRAQEAPAALRGAEIIADGPLNMLDRRAEARKIALDERRERLHQNAAAELPRRRLGEGRKRREGLALALAMGALGLGVKHQQDAPIGRL